MKNSKSNPKNFIYNFKDVSLIIINILIVIEVVVPFFFNFRQINKK